MKILIEIFNTTACDFSAYYCSVAVLIHEDTWRWTSRAETCCVKSESEKKNNLLHYWQTVFIHKRFNRYNLRNGINYYAVFQVTGYPLPVCVHSLYPLSELHVQSTVTF
jgi:hypothetical protein